MSDVTSEAEWAMDVLSGRSAPMGRRLVARQALSEMAAEVERLREENAELRESRDAWRLEAMRQHDAGDAPT